MIKLYSLFTAIALVFTFELPASANRSVMESIWSTDNSVFVSSLTPNVIFGGTVTVNGNAFSVGGSTFAVNGGSVRSGGGLVVTGTLSNATGAVPFPGDNMQISGPDAGLNLFMTTSPGDSVSKESFIRYSGYDASGTAQEIASVSGKWFSTSLSTGGAALRLNSMFMSGGTMQTAVDYRQCGNNGIGIFNGDVCPNVNHQLYVNGAVVASSGTFTQVGSDYSIRTSSGISVTAGIVAMGYETITNNCGSVATCVATCSSGKQLLGGSCYGAELTHVLVGGIPAGNTYTCYASSAVTGNLFAYAICARIGN